MNTDDPDEYWWQLMRGPQWKTNINIKTNNILLCIYFMFYMCYMLWGCSYSSCCDGECFLSCCNWSFFLFQNERKRLFCPSLFLLSSSVRCQHYYSSSARACFELKKQRNLFSLSCLGGMFSFTDTLFDGPLGKDSSLSGTCKSYSLVMHLFLMSWWFRCFQNPERWPQRD